MAHYHSIQLRGLLSGKRILVLFFMLAMFIPSYSYDFIVDGIYYSKKGNNQVAVTYKNNSYNCYSGIVNIPESVVYNGVSFNVTSIGSRAFEDCSGLTSVTIPNSVTSIGNYAFSGCSGLTLVTIPNSVTSIGDKAFEYCSGLTSVTIPNSVTSIGYRAFYWCHGLTSVTILCPKVGSWFSGMASIKEVVIGDGVESIGDKAFSGCSGLTSVTIGNSVTSIGDKAFYNCFMTSVTILCPKVGSWFSGMASIKEVVIGDGVESIGDKAFSSCSGLTSVTIGNSVTSIGTQAFYHCSGLTSVTIPNSVTSIGGSAFEGCSDIYIKILAVVPPILGSEIGTKIIEVPIGSGCKYAVDDHWNKIDTIVSIQDNRRYYPVPLLSHGESIVSVNGVMELGVEKEEGEIIEVLPVNELTQCGLIMKDSLNISDEVLRKGKFVFNTSSNHKRNLIETHAYPTQVIQLSESGTLLKHIGADNINEVYSLKVSGNLNGTDILTIRKMTNLKMLDMEDANIVNGGASYYQDYVTSQNAIGDYFFKEKDNLISIKLPKTITEIRSNAFDGCKKMATITIFPNVTSVGTFAFKDCSGLTSVNIQDIAAWCKIEFYSLYMTLYSNPLEYAHHLYLNGEEIKDLVIPNSVTSIGGSAFRGCSGLTSVTIPNSVTSIGGSAFEDCSDLSSVTILCPKVGSWFSGLTSIKKVTIGDGVESIGNGAFEGCSGLTSVTIPNSVTSIEKYAFSGCSGLTSVAIGNSVTSIGDGAFSLCSALTSVTIPNSVTSIGESAFYRCSGLTSVTIPNSVTSIGDGAFCYCSGLTSVTIPNSVTSIGGSAFEDCSGLTSVTIGNGVTSIENYTFYDCSGLTSVAIPNSVTSIGKYAFDGCSGLTSVTIGNSVTSIGSDAFRLCSGLTSVTIPNSVTSIGESAFKDCSGLTSVTILCPKVGSWFSGMASIKEVVIGDGVESIGDKAFSSCSGLTSVTIGNGVTSIGESAFYGCCSLTSVISLNTTPPKISNSTFSDETYKSATLKVPVGCKNIYWLHPYWENFTKIEEIVNEDISEKQAEAQEAYTKAKDVYLSYMFYYQDQGPKYYQQVLDEYSENDKVARVLLGDIDSVKKKVSSSNMSTEDKESFNKALDELYKNVSLLEYENGKYWPPTAFSDNVQKYYEYISGYYERLNQYKERIDAAQANAELDDIISEMNADAKQTETDYVAPIRKDYNTLKGLESHIVRIGRDLVALKAQLETIIVEINAIAVYNDAVSVYDSYVYYYKGDGQTFYRTTIDKQSDNQKYIGEIFKDIERLKKQISDSSMSDDEKAFYNKTLDEIENAVYALKKENESGYYISFNDRVQEYYESFSDYYSRLEQYKERINTATTNAELDAIIAEIDADAAGMKDDYLISIIYDYNEMVGISQRLTEIGEELSKYQTKLNEITKDVKRGDANGDNAVDGKDIDEIVNYLMGKPSKSFDIKAADVNDDKIVNAADVVAIVTIIKGMYSRDFIDDGHFYGYDETGDSLIIDFEFHTNNGRCNISYRGEFDDADGLHIICGFGMLPKYDIVQIHDNVFDITFDLFCGETAKMSVFARPNGIYLHSVFFNGECKPSSLASGRSCEHLHDNINKVVGTTLLKKTD